MPKKHLCWSLFFKKLQVWRHQHRCFPVNIAKFLKLPFSKNIWERLLIDCFNRLLLHEPKGTRSRLYDTFRLEDPSHMSRFFVFKSVSLVLNRVPTCVPKRNTNTFDESIKFLDWLGLIHLWRPQKVTIFLTPVPPPSAAMNNRSIA